MIYVDVTNFEDQIPIIIEQIRKCDFLSFDFEFSALNINILDELTKYDSIEEQYQKTKFLCLNNHILQFGLSIFNWDGKTMHYRAQCYAFYLEMKGYQGFQSKSYKFLASTDYDFKRTFQYGIPYYQLFGKEKKVKEIEIETHLQQDIQSEIDRIKTIIINTKQPKIKIDCPNSEVLAIMLKQQFQEKYFKGMQRFTLTKYKENTLMIIKNANEFQQFGEPQKPKEIQFQVLVNEVIKSKKILIGHNASIDLCLFYQNFVDDLPQSYVEFGQKFHSLFPILIDTKIVTNHFKEQFNLQKKMKNHLESLFKECYINDKGLKPYNNVIVNFDFLDIYKKKGLHDAGYDSLATGVCCVCMANMMNGKRQQIDFEQQFKQTINKFHSFGYEIDIQNVNQPNLYHNEKFINNTLYGEMNDIKCLEQLINELIKKYTIEKTRIDDHFFITFETNLIKPINIVCDDYQMIPGLKIMPYKNRRQFMIDAT